MQLWVGLGNPGAQICAAPAQCRLHGRRHHRRGRTTSARGQKKFRSLIAEGRIGRQRVLLLKPQTFMNDSGDAVQQALRFYKLDLDALTVFHDELDLAPFKVKVQRRRRHSPATTACARSTRASAPISAASASASATPARAQGPRHPARARQLRQGGDGAAVRHARSHRRRSRMARRRRRRALHERGRAAGCSSRTDLRRRLPRDAALRRLEHLLESRIVAQRIEVAIGSRKADQRLARLRQRRLEQLERLLPCRRRKRAPARRDCTACTYCPDRAAARGRSIRGRARRLPIAAKLSAPYASAAPLSGIAAQSRFDMLNHLRGALPRPLSSPRARYKAASIPRLWKSVSASSVACSRCRVASSSLPCR